jgi:DNA-binding winged helix-turn-helix (wHTH) protein
MTVESIPITFRASEVGQAMAVLRAGDSCAIVGIGSVGKSNLLRFLQREDVRQAYLGDEWAAYLFVYVDVNKMLRRTSWGLWELMLHQLLIELTSLGVDDDILEAVDGLHRRATERETRYLALRFLDRALGMVCDRLGLRLVFLMDEFDGLCRTMSSRGFAALRALRDDHKSWLMYVVATRLELRRLREEISEIEAFEELVSPHTIWLGPYSEDDARFMLHRLEARYNVTLDEETIKAVLSATGGHPGLLREGFPVSVGHVTSPAELLASNSNMQDECQRIWLSLTPKEQQTMVSLAGNALAQPPETQVVQRLRRKGLVGGPWVDDDHVFSPLLAEYIRRQGPIGEAHIRIDHTHRTVWVDGHEVRGLAPLEYKLITYLEEKRGQVCSRDEVARHLYPRDMAIEGPGVTDTRIDSVVKRLRRQIEPNPKEPRYIVTERGHGLRLDDDAADMQAEQT